MVGQLILILAVTNFALFFLLRLIFRRQLDVAMSRLQRLHQENLDNQDRIKREYELAQENHQKEIDKGRQKATEILDVARENATRLKEELLLKVKQEAETVIAAGKKQAEQYKEEAKDELDRKAVEISLELIKSTFSNQAMEILHKQFIDEIIVLINKLDDPRFKGETGKVRVSTAFSLKEEQKAALGDSLNRKTGSQLNLEFKQDEDIIAGLIIYLDELILDASLKNRLRRALEKL